jgi:GMP reductase
MKFIEIKEIKRFHYTGKVYDLEIRDDHSYNINGIVVHNSDFVMAGGIFSGHDENIGNDKSKIIVKRFLTNELDENGNLKIEEKKYLQFYGMSSDTAMNKYYGFVADYRASEGETILVPYKGRIENTIKEILGGLRSTCTYVGAKKLSELSNRVEFVKVNRILNGKFRI